MDTKPIGKDVQAAVKVLKALSNERRLMVVCALYSGEKSVGALEEMVGLSQSALSQHLARLRRDGIVKTRREAQTIYYSLDSSSTERILGCLYDLYCPQTRCFVQNQTGCGCHAPQTREVEGV
ncbi:MAG: metalloregulator ArsR/SmtB family transcription factor [Alphaproteobacteria bacterium]